MKRLLVKYAWWISAILVIVLYVMFFRTAEVNGTSMMPTYKNQDLLLLWRTESVNPGNIIAIYNENLNEVLCKRVIGVAGDHVVVDSSGLCINGTMMAEPYTSTEDWYRTSIHVDLVVPEGEVFVMGDNRIASNDSRALGCMPTSDITGAVICNVTKSFGIRREMLVRAVTILFVASVVFDIWQRLHKVKTEEPKE